MTPPLKTRRQLFDAVRVLISQGWYELPDDGPYGGTGGPGRYLEDLLGLSAGNQDVPDAVSGWELKWYTARTHLITLFNKTPHGPEHIIRHLVRKHGWKDARGRLSFRHTIKGKSDRFRVFEDGDLLKVRPLKGDKLEPYWSLDELVAAVGGKLRRLLLVRGERQGDRIRFLQAEAFETFLISEFAYEVMRGGIAIDFDAREFEPNSHRIRDHGTKFRVPPDSVCQLYAKKERL